MRVLRISVFVTVALFLMVNISYSQSKVSISPESVNIKDKIKNISKAAGEKEKSSQQETVETEVDKLGKSLVENWPYLFPNQKPEICLSTETTLKELIKKGILSKKLKEKTEKLIKECQIMNELLQNFAVDNFYVAEKIYKFENLAVHNKQIRIEMESKYRKTFSKTNEMQLPPFHTMLMELIINSPEATLDYIEEALKTGGTIK